MRSGEEGWSSGKLNNGGNQRNEKPGEVVPTSSSFLNGSDEKSEGRLCWWCGTEEFSSNFFFHLTLKC